MFKSKAIKESAFIDRKHRKEPNGLLANFWKIVRDFVMFKIYYPPIDFYHRYVERINRSLSYAKFGWLHYDFDFAFLYDLLAFKMRRLLGALENGHAVQEDEDMDALKEAIKICDRLHENNYDDNYHEIHDAKWGKTEHESVPIKEQDGSVKFYEWKVWRSGTVNASDEVKKQETQEFRQCYELGEADRLADIDRLAEILKEKSLAWWE